MKAIVSALPPKSNRAAAATTATFGAPKESVHYGTRYAHFRHNLTTLKFDM
jgi:hypothetical protein